MAVRVYVNIDINGAEFMGDGKTAFPVHVAASEGNVTFKSDGLLVVYDDALGNATNRSNANNEIRAHLKASVPEWSGYVSNGTNFPIKTVAEML